MRRRLTAAVLACGVLLCPPAGALAAAPGAGSPDQVGLLAAVRLVPVQFAAADPTHDEVAATRARTVAATLTAGRRGPAGVAARGLVDALRGSEVQLQPWPLPSDVARAGRTLEHTLGFSAAGAIPAKPYAAIRALLAQARVSSRAGATGTARLVAVEAYALYTLGPGTRLDAGESALSDVTGSALWRAVENAGSPAALASAIAAVESGLQTDATVLGDVRPSHASVVADAAVIVFREGLEAVLILAAITASLKGVRRRLRRPVLIGGVLGLLAAAVTYGLAQELISVLGDGGQRLQAITGLLAIAVLLVVTNWFFHRVYWSEWIARFNRRKRTLEKIDRLGFISGQTAGFILLGLTSVYREGFETVLFLQNLQVSAGSGATILGVAIGLGATFAVGTLTFLLEQKLPYRKMLIATGVLIGLVLAVMTGTTVHTLQGLGWLPSHATPFGVSLGLGRWLGLYATWEGIAAQILALLVVYGSYAAARWLQLRRRREVLAQDLAPTEARHELAQLTP